MQSLLIDSATVYAGGAFTNMGGLTRNRAAALYAAGNVTSWDLNVDDLVRALAANGATIYLGGDLNLVNNQNSPSFAIVPMAF